MTLSPLEIEVTTDPLVRGYNGVGSENVGPDPMTDQQVADSLLVKNRTRNRTSMSGREVRSEVVDAEFDALTPEKKAQFLSLTSADDLDPFGFGANVIKDIFTDPSDTLTNLIAARVETISRAEEQGLGAVGAGLIEVARR